MVNNMPKVEKTLLNLLESSEELTSTENLIMESVKELIKEEIKEHIRAKLDENEEIKAEFKKGVEMMMEAKAKEAFSYAIIAKASADLGMELIPPKLKVEMKEKLAEMLEEEIGEILI